MVSGVRILPITCIPSNVYTYMSIYIHSSFFFSIVTHLLHNSVMSRLWQAFGTSGVNVTTVWKTLLLSTGKDMHANNRSNSNNGNNKTTRHVTIPWRRVGRHSCASGEGWGRLSNEGDIWDAFWSSSFGSRAVKEDTPSRGAASTQGEPKRTWWFEGLA